MCFCTLVETPISIVDRTKVLLKVIRISAAAGCKAMARDGTKLALFIDGVNTHAAARALGFDIDYKRLLTEFQGRGTLVRAFYYTVIVEDQEVFALRPLIDWLDYNGFTVVTKPAKEFDDGEGRRKLKRNISVELAIDAMELADYLDQIVLFAGDGDFRSLVEALQGRGVRVAVVSTIESRPPTVAESCGGKLTSSSTSWN
jgi:uncharacterized LabA/DUF88 family protein